MNRCDLWPACQALLTRVRKLLWFECVLPLVCVGNLNSTPTLLRDGIWWGMLRPPSLHSHEWINANFKGDRDCKGRPPDLWCLVAPPPTTGGWHRKEALIRYRLLDYKLLSLELHSQLQRKICELQYSHRRVCHWVMPIPDVAENTTLALDEERSAGRWV